MSWKEAPWNYKTYKFITWKALHGSPLLPEVWALLGLHFSLFNSSLEVWWPLVEPIMPDSPFKWDRYGNNLEGTKLATNQRKFVSMELCNPKLHIICNLSTFLPHPWFSFCDEPWVVFWRELKQKLFHIYYKFKVCS